MQGHTRKHQRVHQEGQGAKRKRGQELLIVVSWEGMGGAGEAKLRLANLNNFSRLWGIGAAPRCLKPGPGVMRAGEYRLEVQCPVGLPGL